ncbi:hypothetical protein NDU88_007575 [Pleurodeles waltl]|uniref:Uncharacterized protein n=1 Tax=Pleurodeles waltl TaxID=8319 RepID=A0AAV7RTF9_PLEWA|nr:hypothetical protein NDU88_007575 [Pleurodeles waltl]
MEQHAKSELPAACDYRTTILSPRPWVEKQLGPVTKRGEQDAEKAIGFRTDPETQDQVSGGGEEEHPQGELGLKGNPGEGWRRRGGTWRSPPGSFPQRAERYGIYDAKIGGQCIRPEGRTKTLKPGYALGRTGRARDVPPPRERTGVAEVAEN